MINPLLTSTVRPNERVKRHAKGLPRRAPDLARGKAAWTPERRARQAAAIRNWQPWRRSTGPKSDAGKARVAMNALRHGYRSRAWILRAKRIRRAIRLCANTVLLVRAHMREQEHLALLGRTQRAGVLTPITAGLAVQHDGGAAQHPVRADRAYAAAARSQRRADRGSSDAVELAIPT